MGTKDTATMTSCNFRLPKKTRLRMRGYDFVNWSIVVRDLLNQKLNQLDGELWTGNLKMESNDG